MQAASVSSSFSSRCYRRGTGSESFLWVTCLCMRRAMQPSGTVTHGMYRAQGTRHKAPGSQHKACPPGGHVRQALRDRWQSLLGADWAEGGGLIRAWGTRRGRGVRVQNHRFGDGEFGPGGEEAILHSYGTFQVFWKRLSGDWVPVGHALGADQGRGQRRGQTQNRCPRALEGKDEW